MLIRPYLVVYLIRNSLRAVNSFFQDVLLSRFRLVTSVLVKEEILLAPEHIKEHFIQFASQSELIEINPAALDLRDAYIKAGIITLKSIDDATHVALATVSQCEIIVSWNFKHIVHFQKIPKYNAINVLHGYRAINIYSPLEVVYYDNA